MTAYYCEEKFDERPSTFSLALEAGQGGGIRAKTTTAHTRTFEVRCSSKYDDGYIACQHYKIPRFFDPHPNDPTSFVRKVSPSPLAGSTVWLVKVEYSSEVPDPSEEETHPLLRPVKSWQTFEEIKVPVYQDRNGNPIVNTAGVPYDPPIEIPSENIIYHFERNEATYFESRVVQFLNKLNSSSYVGKNPRTVRCRRFEGEPKTEKGFRFFTVNYEFEFNWFGYDPNPLSRGVLQIDEAVFQSTGDIRHVRIKDVHGRDVTSPVPLDGDGYALTPDSVLNNPNLLSYQTFEVQEEADFGQLNLPQNGS